MSSTDPIELADEELDDFLSGPEPEWDEEPEAPPDADRADRMLYRLQRIRNSRRHDQAAARMRAEQVASWLAQREARYDAQAAWLEGALTRYHQAVLSLNPKALTISLPAGDLASGLGQREWTVDEEKVLEWALPENARARLMTAYTLYTEALGAVAEIIGDDRCSVVKMPLPAAVSMRRDGLKRVGTRRDEKGKAVAWGVDSDGKPIPGVTVSEPERKFSVRLPDEQGDTDEEEGR